MSGPSEPMVRVVKAYCSDCGPRDRGFPGGRLVDLTPLPGFREKDIVPASAFDGRQNCKDCGAEMVVQTEPVED